MFLEGMPGPGSKKAWDCWIIPSLRRLEGLLMGASRGRLGAKKAKALRESAKQSLAVAHPHHHRTAFIASPGQRPGNIDRLSSER